MSIILDPDLTYEALVKEGRTIYHNNQKIVGGSVVQLNGRQIAHHRVSLEDSTISPINQNKVNSKQQVPSLEDLLNNDEEADDDPSYNPLT